MAKSSPTRYTDAFRRPSLYEQIAQQAVKDGRLPERFTAEEFGEVCDTMRAEGKLEGHVHDYIGNDLREEDLDNLWAIWAGSPDPDSIMPGWWEDKPHQIAYRLILRLTRAEVANAEMVDMLTSLEWSGPGEPNHGDYSCPSCRAFGWDDDPGQHADDCKLDTLLKGTR